MLRCDQRPGDLASGNGVHRTTVTRWVREAVGLLAARAPRLDRALKKIARTGGGGSARRHPDTDPAAHRHGEPEELLRP
ncbi:transposase family protein [Streptomyces sp. PRh5]|uniref:transposase family protein n=1 Tax=Streptomyces sp. PRh5 TaxID=1158056 RepID=UPI001F528959|nr:transposase family protein [Streptomyces sp. PRh5]